jgi:nucleotide-binding universal stress UspA family protein
MTLPVVDMGMITRILVPMDDSEMSDRALEYALENHPDAQITVMHVVGEPSPMLGTATGLSLKDDLEAAAGELAAPVFDRARTRADEADVAIRTVVQLGPPAREIIEAAEDYDAVVIGSHAGSLADRLLIGNTAEKVFRRSPVPVVTVR